MAGLEGQILDRYELLQITGRGGMADVYRGFDPVFQREVAVKVFKREDENLLQRFVREARLMASLNHPHLMPVFDTGESWINGVSYYYIVMPFMRGGTLRTRIRRAPLTLKEVCRCMREIADALDYIHGQGIIHRDIKSSNVLLNEEGTCYLSDFGIAHKSTDATQLTSTGNVLGTVDYVAPELFEEYGKADERSDFYSLGVLLFEMVTGRLPFVAENQIAVVTMHVNKRPPLLSSLVPNINPQVDLVMLKALEKNPDLRYGSAREFAHAFCRAVSTRGSAETLTGMQDTQSHVSARRTQGGINAPVRASINGVDGGRHEPLVLPAGPASGPATGVPRQTRRIPQAYATGAYPYAPAGRQMPAYQARAASVRRRVSSSRSRGRIVIVLALLTLLAVIGPITYVLIYHPVFGNQSGPNGQTATISNITATEGATATPTLDKTATAQANAIATQQTQNATATAIAGVTATAQAKASATAGVIQTATAGNVIYQDGLNNPASAKTVAARWDQKKNCTFNTDGYHVTENLALFDKGQLQGCMEAKYQYQNMTVSVDTTILSGHSGGLFFRMGTRVGGAYSGYLFEIDSKGNYKVSRSSNFTTGQDNKILQDWTASSALKSGNSTKNRLQVIANSNDLSFYANNKFLIAIQDSIFTSGNIALLATTEDNGPNADVVYTNLNVYGLS